MTQTLELTEQEKKILTVPFNQMDPKMWPMALATKEKSLVIIEERNVEFLKTKGPKPKSWELDGGPPMIVTETKTRV
jgi:hypothetical protein